MGWQVVYATEQVNSQRQDVVTEQIVSEDLQARSGKLFILRKEQQGAARFVFFHTTS